MPDPNEIADDDTRLIKLENHALKSEGRLDTIEKVQGQQSVKLDQIFTAVTIQQNAPKFDIHKMISTVRDILGIAGVFGFLAVWLIVTLNAATERATALDIKHNAEIANMRNDYTRERLDRLMSAFTWRPSIEGVK